MKMLVKAQHLLPAPYLKTYCHFSTIFSFLIAVEQSAEQSRNRKGAEQSRNRFASCVHSTATGKSLMQETLDWDRILIVQEIWDGDRTIVTEEKKIFSP